MVLTLAPFLSSIAALFPSSSSLKSPSDFPAGPSGPLSASILSAQPVPNIWPRIFASKTLIQGYLFPSLYRPDLVPIPQIIRVHSLPEADGLFHPRPLLWFKSAFHAPHFPSIVPPAAPARTRSPSPILPHWVLTSLPPYPPGTPLFCGCSQPGVRIPNPASPAGTSPLPGSAVLPSPQVAPLSLQQESVRPSRFAGPPTPTSQRLSLSNWPKGWPRRGAPGVVGPAGSPEHQPHLPQGFPGGAGPSPHRPATSQTYLRVAGRGLR